MGRDGEVWRRWVAGESQAAIGASLGISQGRVSQICKDVWESMDPEEREAMRLREQDIADRVRLASVELMESPEVSPGDRVAAGRLVLQTSERLARLLGLDAAQRTDVTITGSEEAAARAAAAASAAFVHGGEAPA